MRSVPLVVAICISFLKSLTHAYAYNYSYALRLPEYIKELRNMGKYYGNTL